MTEYTLKQDCYIFSDCNFSAENYGMLNKYISFTISEEIGPWLLINIDGEDIGWVYSYSESGASLLQEAYKAGSLGFRIGDLITINGQLNYAKDYYKNTIMTKDKDGTPITYIVKDIFLDPDRVKVSYNNRNFYFTLDNITLASEHNDYKTSLLYDTVEDNDSVTDKVVKKITATPHALYEAVTGLKENVFDNLYDEISSFIDGDDYDIANEKLKNYVENLSKLRVENLKGIMGCPYQFLPIADLRITGNVTNASELGVKYAEKIVTKMPLLIMQPGIPNFMAGYTEEQKTQLTTLLANTISDKSSLDAIMNKGGRYYDFIAAWNSYYQYLNPLCQVCAILLGLGDVRAAALDSTGTQSENIKLKEFNWAYGTSDAVKKLFNFRGGCSFYVNSETNVSESLSSETTESQLASKINAISDQARELLFLISSSVRNVGAGTGSDMLNKLNPTNWFNQDGKSSPTTVMNGIMNGMGNIITGGKMMFPELWSDSSFSRDYNVNIKLISPDCDRLSLYMNIIVPLLHLLVFAAPRAMSNTVYTSPFLVRAYYKGFFNINMGIITSMNISKGGEGFWTYEGIPTEVDVSFTIKDLFGCMMLTLSNPQTGDNVLKNNKYFSFLHPQGAIDLITNTVLMDYLCNMCGININEPDLARTLTLYKSIWSNNGTISFIKNTPNYVQQWIDNSALNLYNKMIRSY